MPVVSSCGNGEVGLVVAAIVGNGAGTGGDERVLSVGMLHGWERGESVHSGRGGEWQETGQLQAEGIRCVNYPKVHVPEKDLVIPITERHLCPGSQ